MSSRMVQVPMEDELRERIDAAAQAQGKARAEVIREACRAYVQRLKLEEMKRRYREGYRLVPEAVGELSGLVEAYSLVLPDESWDAAR